MSDEKPQDEPETIGLAATDTKERDDAQEAKEKADPAVNDPGFMPNIEPQTGSKE